MKIRRMEEQDRACVFRMMQVFYASPALLHKSSDAVLRRSLDAALSEDQPLLEGYMFEEDGRSVGYSLVSLYYSTEYGGECIFIEDIYLEPEARGRGLTGEYLEFLTKAYPEAVRFKLEVEAENVNAIKAYKKSGYEISEYYLMTREMIED